MPAGGFRRPLASFCTLTLLGLATLWVMVLCTTTAAFAVPASTLTVTNTEDDGPGSLRQAIADAQHGDTIDFALSYPSTITLISGELVISKSLTVTGPGPEFLAVSGNSSSRVFRLDTPTGTLTISATVSGMTIRDGNPTLGSGGGLSNGNSDLALMDVIFRSNEACAGGGMSNGGTALLRNVAFYDNAALCNSAGNGGGLSNGSDTLTLRDVTFVGNYSDEYGGGMVNYGSSPTLMNVTFRGNSARLEGGGMRNGYGGHPTLTHVTFRGNSARFGGGLSNYVDSNPLLVDVTFGENSAEYGGGMSSVNSNPALRNVLFRGNSAMDGLYGGRGGGMTCSGNPTLTDVTFINNTGRMGGGLYIGSGTPALTRVVLEGNSAENGGGGLHNEGASPALANVTFSGNSASYGGGMSSFGGAPTLINVIFRGNWASGGVSLGGGLCNYESSPTLTNVAIQGNWADSGGGGLCNRGSSAPTLTHVTISGNVAAQGGGMYNDGGSHPVIQNSILWANHAISNSHQIYNQDSTPTIAHSTVEGSGGSGAGWDAGLGADLGGNVDDPPKFVVPIDPNRAPTSIGDLRLWAGSPAADAGNNSLLPPGVTTDLAGVPRIANGIVDMGAYEVQPGLYLHKMANRLLVKPADYVTYTVRAANTFSDTIVAGVVISDALPAGLEFVGPIRLDPPTAGNVGMAPPILVTNLVMNPGEAVTITLPVVVSGGASAGIVTNAAVLTSSQVATPRLATCSLEICHAEISVTSSDDGSSGSLRQALAHVCPGGTIDFGLKLPATINLSEGQLMIDKPMAITGPGADHLTISANGVGRVFQVEAAEGVRPITTTISGLTIRDGVAPAGGGLWNGEKLTLTDVSFRANHASRYGGGMYNGSGSSSILESVLFVENSAEEGGGMYSFGSAEKLTRVAFSGNWAGTNGGGMFNEYTDLVLTNVVFSGNAARDYGGGMYSFDCENSVLTGTSFNGNRAGEEGGGIRKSQGDMILQNSILWGNEASSGNQISNNSGSLTIAYSDLQGWAGGGIGNLDVNPQFVAPIDPSVAPTTSGDLRLQSGSLAINAGNNHLLPAGTTTDLDGNPRISLGTVDMGAYEVQPYARFYLPIVEKGRGP